MSLHGRAHVLTMAECTRILPGPPGIKEQGRRIVHWMWDLLWDAVTGATSPMD